MRLARKLTLALVVAIFAVMAGNAYLQVRREVSLFEADLIEDQHIIGETLRSAVETIWRTADEAAARALVDRANKVWREVRVRFVWLDAPAGSFDAPGVTPRDLRTLSRSREGKVVWHEVDGEERRYVYVPLSLPDARPAALELSQSVGWQHRFIRTSELQSLAALVAIVALCGLIAMGLGVWFVGRPVQHLAEKARRVGAGDFAGRLQFRQHDEIGELAREVNAMCDQLEEADRRITSETEARIATLEQLRHADRLKTVGQLASGVAHELGTPLNVVAARGKMIAAGGLGPEELVQNGRIIGEQAERMTGIIRQLLDFSRRRGPNLGVGQLDAIAARTLEMLSALAAKRGVTLHLDAPEALPPVWVDQNQIQQALTNLVLNGIQAMARGGRLDVGVSCRHVHPPAGHDGVAGEYVCVTVEDQGSGIAPEHVSHVFEPFFTTKGVGEGTGLGLSVAYGIVHDHGGWLDVESQVGRGTRFTVFLRPAASVELHASEQAS
jgi:signal transduction histidine kinase